MTGYTHLYTGNGKGKTTAALGLALRAAGAGKTVFIAQFVKGMQYSEMEVLKLLPQIRVQQFGLNCFIKNQATLEDIKAAKKGLAEVKSLMQDSNTDVLILDEICIALHYHLFEVEEVLGLIKIKPPEMEIIMTGRYAPPELYDAVDLITEMKEIKHYYTSGIEARKGIDF